MTKAKLDTFKIPPEVSRVTEALKENGFEAYLVGGCVRDLILGKKPKDWDVTTNAKPDEIIASFSKTFYENNFGTVGVVNEETADETMKVVEVTPYRIESGYSDYRRPDKVEFGHSLEEDLKRRDFTINAFALNLLAKNKDIYKGQLIDLYKGHGDLEKKLIRSVGDPDLRFNEDALRMVRAVRLSAELGFAINKETAEAIKSHAHLLKNIALERISVEFRRIIESDHPKHGLELLREYDLLGYILPELEKGIGVEQNKAHSYDVWEHILRTVQHAADKGWPLEIRLAALFHDISKPETRRWSEEKKEWTFYGHEVVGSRVTRKALERLKFSRETVEKVSKLVRWHMFFSDTEQISLSAVRRLLAKVGKENIWDLMNVRICDRIGTGRPKEDPYRLRKYKSMIEQVMRDPISVGMLKVNGLDVIRETKLDPGPKIGFILHALLEEVLENPQMNTEEYLKRRAVELSRLPEKVLKEIGEKGKVTKDQEEEKEITELRKKYWVRETQKVNQEKKGPNKGLFYVL